MPKKRKQTTNQKYLSMNLTNDFAFKYVMEIPVIHTAILKLLGIKPNLPYHYCSQDKRFVVGHNTRDIVCDVVSHDNSYNVYDLEMQRKDPNHDLIKRSEHYTHMLLAKHYLKKNCQGATTTSKVRNYLDIPTVYSIWFCEGNFIGDGKAFSEIVNVNTNNDEIVSQTFRYFYDITRWEEFDGHLKDLFHFMVESTREVANESDWEIIHTMCDELEKIKGDKRKEKKFMHIEHIQNEAYNLGEYEGKLKGILEGKIEGKREEKYTNILNMYHLDISVE